MRPRLEMSWRPAGGPIDAPVAKLGGRPSWLDEPFWPVRPDDGAPMMFVGQIPVPGPQPRLAYLFVAEDDDGLAQTFELEGGENALLVQPGGRVPPFVTGVPAATGPALWRRGARWTDRVPVELQVDLRPPDAAAEAAYARELAGDKSDGLEWRSYVGGQPLFWQPWTTDIDDSWQFHFQLDDPESWGGDQYGLTFGGGTGFAFLSEDQLEGRFFWDCV